MIRKYSLLVLVLAALISCSNHTMLSPKDYMHYIKDPANGLYQLKDTGPFRFEVQYEPLEYICLIQNGSPEISEDQLTSLKSEFEGLMYFKFTISNKEKVDPLTQGNADSLELENRIRYLTGEANKDFWLLQQTDTVRCVLHHFERNYGLAPRLDVVMAFENLKSSSAGKSEPIQFCFRDRLFNSGIHQFVFESSVLRSIPSLKTN